MSKGHKPLENFIFANNVMVCNTRDIEQTTYNINYTYQENFTKFLQYDEIGKYLYFSCYNVVHVCILHYSVIVVFGPQIAFVWLL